MDCDGVLTDGRLYYSPEGETLKVFDVRDGYGLAQWHKAGLKSAIISGRSSPMVQRRAEDLGIEFVIQGREDKSAAFDEMLAAANVTADEVAFIADDTIDLPLFSLVCLAVAVGDAHPAVKPSAHYVTMAKGGRGAVREVIDMILKVQGRT